MGPRRLGSEPSRLPGRAVVVPAVRAGVVPGVRYCR
jgi:hypothetical protein